MTTARLRRCCPRRHPVLALLMAFVLTSLVLLALGDPVRDVWITMLEHAEAARSPISSTGAIVLYLSAIAVAVGFG